MNLTATVARAAALVLAAGAMQLSHAQSASADGLVEGKDYQLISPAQPTHAPAGKIEVAEVFMYSCPHCFEFEPHWEAWEKRKAGYIDVIRLPTSWNSLAVLHARAYYTEEVLGKLDEMDNDFFEEFHVKHDALDTPEKLQAFFARYGVSADEFTKAFNSFAVHTKVKRADELVRRYKVTGTPAVVINGKYLTTGAMSGSYDHWFEIIDKLAAREYKAITADKKSGS